MKNWSLKNGILFFLLFLIVYIHVSMMMHLFQKKIQLGIPESQWKAAFSFIFTIYVFDIDFSDKKKVVLMLHLQQRPNKILHFKLWKTVEDYFLYAITRKSALNWATLLTSDTSVQFKGAGFKWKNRISQEFSRLTDFGKVQSCW